MLNLAEFSNYFFLAYLSLYVLTHFPFDIYMLLRRDKASYPIQRFESTLEGLSVVLASFLFWFYLVFSPTVVLSSGNNIFVLENVSDEIRMPFIISGVVIMSLGLIVGCLGRIGRGAYLAKQEAKLSTNWGHAIVRHPSYFLYITGFIGLPFAAFSPYLFVLLLGIPGYIVIAKNEEEALIKEFGTEYEDYMKKVGRFFIKIRRKR
jgi:protein-S-isoprenylcysteine O-methyltransferase Ste14